MSIVAQTTIGVLHHTITGAGLDANALEDALSRNALNTTTSTKIRASVSAAARTSESALSTITTATSLAHVLASARIGFESVLQTMPSVTSYVGVSVPAESESATSTNILIRSNASVSVTLLWYEYLYTSHDMVEMLLRKCQK